MAFVTHHFPGAGITPWTVEGLQLHWWVYYVRAAQHVVEESKKATEG